MNPDPVQTAVAPGGTPTGSTSSPAREMLAFKIGDEEYAIDILQVQEIRSFEAPTRIANAPSAVAGVLNLRGVIVPIVDLRSHLGAERRFDAGTVTIVLNLRRRTVGVVVDAVCDVVELSPEQIRTAPALGSAAESGAISGFASVMQADCTRMLIMTDIECLLGQIDIGLAEPIVH